MVRPEAISRAVNRLTREELKRLRESLDHAMTKPHRHLAELIPTLIRGHHQISDRQAERINAAIKRLTSDELEYLVENIERLMPD